ncbi:erad-associated e3 ubiquitin-protein ligase component-related [Anaeramoeba flamelloides]|uniref:Erad-associated e3 ubiquitin-protein ligase component-related n=1 Tax=Anaeramoeba flamelloides TaxID=1746091 RepID=A0AAV7YHP2_9EUKA|nr:erad-associated e3 ubiquitin-protein ligase component-related [Anaeramoeba flamelloides]KAJ6237830.1 erad-associated e3 ubiquitin-protein ligase component-related [Anaeramoeba flamelloides]
MFVTLQNQTKEEKTKQKLKKTEIYEYSFEDSKNSLILNVSVPPLSNLYDLEIGLLDNYFFVCLTGNKPIIEGMIFDSVEIPQNSSSLIDSTHVQITLIKKNPNVRWPVLISGPSNSRIDPFSSYLLSMYLESCGDYITAFKWLIKAADEGHFTSSFKVAAIYTTDTSFPIESNPEKAFHYWKLAAKSGQWESVYMTGCYYYSGEGCEKNYAKSLKYFQRSLKEGNAGYHYIGLIYDEGGYGVERDDDLAMKNYVTAANSGNTKSMLRIAIMLIEGRGAVRDFKKAKRFLLLAKKIDPLLQIPETLEELLEIGQERYEQEFNVKKDEPVFIFSEAIKKNKKSVKTGLTNNKKKTKETQEQEKGKEMEKGKGEEKKKEKEKVLTLQEKSEREEYEELFKKKNRKFSWIFTFGSLAIVSSISLFNDYSKRNQKNKENL